MDDIESKLKSLGHLHDSIVRELIWKPAEKTVEFVIEDFYSNFEGLASYPGLVGGSVVLRDVQYVKLDIESKEKHLTLYKFSAEDVGSGNSCITALFRPSGRVEVVCRVVQFPELSATACCPEK